MKAKKEKWDGHDWWVVFEQDVKHTRHHKQRLFQAYNLFPYYGEPHSGFKAIGFNLSGVASGNMDGASLYSENTLLLRKQWEDYRG